MIVSIEERRLIALVKNALPPVTVLYNGETYSASMTGKLAKAPVLTFHAWGWHRVVCESTWPVVANAYAMNATITPDQYTVYIVD